MLKPRALGLRGVPRTDRDRRDEVRVPAACGRLCDARERRAQVALHVDRECLERRDVQDAAPAGFGRRREHQAIETPEERRQRLAAADRREDERRLAARDRRSTERLRTGRRLEGDAEPRTHRRIERRERLGLRRGRPRGHLIM